MKPIIKSLLDNDLYKLTMLQAFHHYESKTDSEYAFTCRSPGINFSCIVDRLYEQIESLCSLTFSEDELLYLNKLPFIKDEFITFLRTFRLNKDCVSIELTYSGNLEIGIKGKIIESSLFEVHLMSLINQLYFEGSVDKSQAYELGAEKLKNKIELIRKYDHEIVFMDFGTRRRYSFDWHKNVIKQLIDSNYSGFVGTSNVYFAKKFGIKPMGTMAHEWIMSHAGLYKLEESQNIALKRWHDFYGEELSIALTDTYTTDFFLRKLDYQTAAAFNGLRQDSGSWKEWGYKVLRRYNELGIDSREKTFVFSDGLDFNTVIDIHREFYNKVKLVFGVGTDLTNDVGVKPIQIVIKMVRCNGKPVLKISDTPAKAMCIDPIFKESAIQRLAV